MRVLARILVVLAAAVLARAAEAGPRGRVVRIERSRPTEVAQWCQINLGAGRDQSMCAGRPQVGDNVTLLDNAAGNVVGVFRIDAVAAETEAIYCPERTNLWSVSGSLVWSTGAANGNPVISVRGVTLDPHIAKALANQPLPPSAAPEESSDIAIDADGNGSVDIMITQYGCDDHGKPTTRQPLTGLCLDTWQRHGDVLKQVHQDYVPLCIQ